MESQNLPNWWEAPEDLLNVDGHCGLLAAWMVLASRARTSTAAELVRACRHTKRHGIFTVSLAAALIECGLKAGFHSDPDIDIGGFERRCYARARRLGVTAQPALTIDQLLERQQQGDVPIVLFNTDADLGHFSPVTGKADGRLLLPLAEHGTMLIEEFLIRWSAPGILRQCVIVR